MRSDQCRGMHEVAVQGVVTAAASSGGSSFTASVRIVREEFGPGRFGNDGRRSDAAGSKRDARKAADQCSSPGTATVRGSGTTTTSSTAASGTGTTTSGSPTRNSDGTLVINTDSATKISVKGSPSTVGSLAVGDQIIAAFIVPRYRPLSADTGLTAVCVADSGPSSTTTGTTTTGSATGSTTTAADPVLCDGNGVSTVSSDGHSAHRGRWSNDGRDHRRSGDRHHGSRSGDRHHGRHDARSRSSRRI